MRRLLLLATLALVGAAAVFNSTVTSASTTVTYAPPNPGRQMQWFRSQTAARSLVRGAARFGSSAVIGLESMRDLAALRRSYGFETVQAMPTLRAARVRLAAAQLHALLAHAPGDRRLRYVSPLGSPRHVSDLSNPPLVESVDPKTTLPYEWQFASANLAGALALTAGDPRIQVGIIDTGVDAVPDLAGKIDGLYDVTAHGTQLSPSTAGNDDYGHGTAVASLIAANGFGMAGFGGAAHVIGIHADNQGRFYDTDLAQAIAKLDALGVRIVNLSIGGPEPSSPILVDAINKAASDGMLIVAASGNESGPVDWPAALLQPSGGGESYGLAVGATNAKGSHAWFSNFDRHLSLVAPGILSGDCSGVLVALPQQSQLLSDTCYRQWTGSGGADYGYVAGTSFASPEVAGVAALVWAARPELKNYQVAEIIKASADRDAGTSWTPTMGCGRLDAAAAVTLALSRTAAEWASGPPAAGPCTAASVAPPALPHTQTITFKPIPDRTTGDGDFNPNAHASSGLPVTYTAYGGCTMRHGIVHVFAGDLCWITAYQNGNNDVYAARPVLQVVAITESVTPVALPAAGYAGSLVRLRYRSTTLGIVATDVVIDRNGKAIARLHKNASVVDQGGLYAIAWHAPRAAARGSLRFCVSFRNRTPGAPIRNYTSCAHIRLLARPN